MLLESEMRLGEIKLRHTTHINKQEANNKTTANRHNQQPHKKAIDQQPQVSSQINKGNSGTTQ